MTNKEKPQLEENKEIKNEELKTEEKTNNKSEEKKPKKTEVIARGLNLHASKKHLMYISRFIKNKTIDQAISDLQEVIKLKKAVPFKGEIPHRKGKGIMSGRYPVNASKLIINVLKGLKGNAISAGMDLDNTRIYFASPNWASRPYKRGGMRFKRANILIKAKLFEEIKEKKQEEKK